MDESSLIAELRKNRTQYGEGVAFAYAMGGPPSWLADNGVQFERLVKQIKDLEAEQNQPNCSDKAIYNASGDLYRYDPNTKTIEQVMKDGVVLTQIWSGDFLFRKTDEQGGQV